MMALEAGRVVINALTHCNGEYGHSAVQGINFVVLIL